MHITKVEWLDKDASQVTLDLATGTCPGLSQEVEVDEITRSGNFVKV